MTPKPAGERVWRRAANRKPSKSRTTRNITSAHPVIGRSLAKAYLTSQDPKLLARTWQDVMDEFCSGGKPQTQADRRRVANRRPQNLLRNMKLIETSADGLMKILKGGGVMTNALTACSQTFLPETTATDGFSASLFSEAFSLAEKSNWREILEYFEPACQLGMTATPKREDNRDTCLYFGNPIYTYSLRQGIDDGFLAPYRVHRITTQAETHSRGDVVLGRGTATSRGELVKCASIRRMQWRFANANVFCLPAS